MIVLFAIGNRSRGDDAAGPQLLDQLLLDPQIAENPNIHTEECYQLQPENVEQLQGAHHVWFIDAAIGIQQGFKVVTVKPGTRFEFSNHVLPPASLLTLYQQLYNHPAPRSLLLQIGAHRFELGEPVSDSCLHNIQQAAQFLISRICTID